MYLFSQIEEEIDAVGPEAIADFLAVAAAYDHARLDVIRGRSRGVRCSGPATSAAP